MVMLEIEPGTFCASGIRVFLQTHYAVSLSPHSTLFKSSNDLELKGLAGSIVVMQRDCRARDSEVPRLLPHLELSSGLVKRVFFFPFHF